MPVLRIEASIYDETNSRQRLASYSVTTGAEHRGSGRINVGTTEETIAIPTDVTNVGFIHLQNKDATNFIEVGFATGVYPIRLLAGEANVFRLHPTGFSTLYVKADTAPCDLDYEINEA